MSTGVLHFFHLSNKRASEIFKRRFKEKKKYWLLVLAKQQTEQKQNHLSDYKHTHRNVTWNTPKKLQQCRHLTIRWSFPPKMLFRKEEVSLYSGCFKIVPLFGKDIFTWDDPSNTILGCLQNRQTVLFLKKFNIDLIIIPRGTTSKMWLKANFQKYILKSTRAND